MYLNSDEDMDFIPIIPLNEQEQDYGNETLIPSAFRLVLVKMDQYSPDIHQLHLGKLQSIYLYQAVTQDRLLMATNLEHLTNQLERG